ncbi:MAG TPA: hemin uptake protein HemP [Planctomycetota bacterium]|nr:hemin uptake protein HemP [Planctomycetota bacterium]
MAHQPPEPKQRPAPPPPPEPRRVRSNELFEGAQQVVIEHGGQEYLLLITRNGRLLLNARR